MKIQPPFLKPNDQVALIAPSGVISGEEVVLEAEKWLLSVGLVPVRGKHILDQSGVFSGTDVQRLEDLQWAIDASDIKAIWALRGGYGAMRIMQQLDFLKFKKYPKWLIGFSDITAFHNQINNLGFQSIHGIMPVQIYKDPIKITNALKSLKNVLFEQKLSYSMKGNLFNRKGSAESELVGGNLTLLESLLGTPYELKTKGKILFLEEISEYAYRVDRSLRSLQLAGIFENLAGLIVGQFTDIKDGDVTFDKSYQEMILEVTQGTDYPILFDFPAGHVPDNRTLILGSKIYFKTSDKQSFIEFSLENDLT
jgi:muramoyltetrapeptide carboxypeptidase